MDRRTALQALALYLLAFSGGAAGRDAKFEASAWSAWKDRFLSGDGRVIDDGNGGISHSEGQGFGALLAQANGDKPAFEQIEAWTRANLLVRHDHLMAWRWREGAGVAPEDQVTATDGDLFRAWALLRAARDSGWPEWAYHAEEIARDLALCCLRPDPRVRRSPLLIPGSASRADAKRVLINPSYIMPRALRELGSAAARADLIAAADHGETVLSELAELGAVPDWVDVTPEGFAAPFEHDYLSGYDALRVALYLVWSGNAGHGAVKRGLEMMSRAGLEDHVAVVTTPGGEVREQSNFAGYAAIAELASCVQTAKTAGDLPDQPYFPATLELLAILAAREGGTCKP
ncbi:glycosyl hydrolase family 8 [Sulfitobacter porphyrae]|uniref:cellulase n=1 Tax=Sulfitobacter porphyrae TaxID=1246864 RepID=A0ABW2B6X3_9RHOB